MTASTFSRARAFFQRARQSGLKESLRAALLSRLVRPEERLPLSRAVKPGLLTEDTAAIHEMERQQIRASSLLFDSSNVEKSYPLVFERDGRFLRYAFLPALERPRGIVVLFHGHDAFMHMGPARRWRNFHLLAPWDTFGYMRQGSWFWGEKGIPFVEDLVQALIHHHLTDHQELPLFYMGGSMGGFASLFHGIRHGASGLYVMCPQIDIRRMIASFGEHDPTNPYLHLKGAGSDDLPDLLGAAEASSSLPPLFLVQNQYDHVNPFADHAWKLLDVYNRKSGWYGIRVHPAVGHGGDGSQEEAELFFSLILDRRPPARFSKR